MKKTIASLGAVGDYFFLVWGRLGQSQTDRYALNVILAVLVTDGALGLLGSLGVRHHIAPKLGWPAFIGLQATFTGIASALLWVASAAGPKDLTVSNVRNAAAGALSGTAVVLAFGTVSIRHETGFSVWLARGAPAISEVAALVLISITLWTVIRWRPHGSCPLSKWWPLVG